MAGSAFQNTQHPGKAVRVEKRRGRRRRVGGGHPQRQRLRDDVRRTENSSGDDFSLDDKHLKARLSVYIEGAESSKIYLSTLVKFHNRLGVAYFLVIRPFHAMIVKRIFAQVMRYYERNSISL